EEADAGIRRRGCLRRRGRGAEAERPAGGDRAHVAEAGERIVLEGEGAPGRGHRQTGGRWRLPRAQGGELALDRVAGSPRAGGRGAELLLEGGDLAPQRLRLLEGRRLLVADAGQRLLGRGEGGAGPGALAEALGEFLDAAQLRAL